MKYIVAAIMSRLIALTLGAAIGLSLVSLVHHQRLPACDASLDLGWVRGMCR